jgi:hypothetical protein
MAKPAIVTLTRWTSSFGHRLPIEIFANGTRIEPIPKGIRSASFLFPPDSYYDIRIDMDGYVSNTLRIYAKSLRRIFLSLDLSGNSRERAFSSFSGKDYFSIALKDEEAVSFSDMVEILKSNLSYDGNITKI